MQIDGHHALTYIAARFAGFSQMQASTIAYSAQYVDDATNSGTIKFSNGAMYNRISSAHQMLDYRNFDELANHQVWAPFHFLPGNNGLPAGENPHGSFIHKLVCHPDSFVAKDMLKQAIADRDKPYGLHRLGISLHVYADTFAHQGFAGVTHKVNEVHHLKSNDSALDQGFFQKIKSFFVSESYPLGHGAALSFPDKPYLVWSYTNGLDQKVKRDNRDIFLEATDKMCRVMQCFRHGNLTEQDLGHAMAQAPGLPIEDAQVIKLLLDEIRDNNGEVRHQRWLEEIAHGKFSFGPERPVYIAKGQGSWKYQAIGQLEAIDQDDEEFVYSESFLTSDWKMFHDALQAYRFDVLHDILPRYGICAA
ncbi:DUF6765 family protein [Shewanella gelidii]|uniref:Uncharacterized protein n=1 Tax=Shewanella gelidii TaxID=1642821 RepID=A0A917JLQ0_9GAMM|nr:DUF6765 family protein [Shewanella gelidii]MCL1096941.1 hypothetical protein [Shewanella gelidii]GGI71389.1 hypothetical protein GCM10009332_05860 [Shewanella gelidii]